MTTVHIFLISALLGAMVFFSAVVTPVAFKALNDIALRDFLRAVFPKLFSLGIIISLLSSSILCMNQQMALASLSLLVTLGFGLNRFWLTKKINYFRDQAGENVPNAEKQFKIFHRISVGIYLTQTVSLSAILILDPTLTF